MFIFSKKEIRELLQLFDSLQLENKMLRLNVIEAQKEIQGLQVKLIDSRAEYLNTLDKNPDCSAWNLDEMSAETQLKLRQDACKSLEMEEPLLLIEIQEKDEYITRLEENFLDAEKGKIFWRQVSRDNLKTLPEIYEFAEKESHAALNRIKESV